MKRKKLFSIVMSVVLSLCSLPLTTMQAQESLAAFPEEELFKKGRMEDFKELRPEVTPQEGNVNTARKTGEEFYDYEELEDGTLLITGYSGNDTELVVPDEIDGKPVTRIGRGAFEGCSSLIKIKLPASLSLIVMKPRAFEDCSNLTEIAVDENNPTYMSQDGILYDKNQTKLICCPEGKVGDVVISESVTSIQSFAFEGCSSLTSIKLPAGLNDVMKEEVDDVGETWCSPVFRGCSSLTEIIVDINNESYTSRKGLLYDKNQTKLICCPGGKKGNITIPPSVVRIGPYAFYGCNSLTKIELPGELERIAGAALEESVSVFRGCSSLTEIIVDGNNANYTSQEGILYDKNQTRLICCPGGKTGNIVIPAGVTSIEYDAFYGCRNLTEIIVDGNNANYTSQEGILYDKNQKELICCPGGKAGSIVIPAGVTSIEYDAFRGCSSLTSIELPEGVTSIEHDAFNGCSSLRSIGLPSSVTRIGWEAFRGCSSLTSIELPEGVTSIEHYTFNGCSSLRSIELPSSLASIEYTAFEDCNRDLTLLVYKGSYAETYAKKQGLNYRYIDSKDCYHTWKTTIVKATAKRNGSITKTCTKCGEQDKETIYAAKTIKLSKTSDTYNGKKQKPSVTVKNNKGKILKNKKDYTVTYPKTMKNVGSYIVTIKLKGNYKGNVKKIFQIVPKGTQISRIKPKKKGLVLKWRKQAVQTTGYEIAYSTNKTFTKKTTGTAVVGKNNTISRTVSKLKAGKKYFVKIRTYKTVKLNGKPKKLYSAWSKVKTVTTPK